MKLFNQYTKYLLSGSIIAATLLSSTNVSLASGTNTEDNKKPSNDEAIAFGNTKNPKNVIFLVGDGMGPSFNTAYRYYQNDPSAKSMKPTTFYKYLKGTNRTYPNDPKENITDSAAGATAFSSGHKTYNGAIGVDANKKNVKTVLESAKEKGKSTGLVSTAEITDATPAAYASHVDSRDKKMKLRNSFIMIKLTANIK